ncbi:MULTISPECIES: hypothetical protein [Streptomyces]|uniref:Uncharacterized protein n=1 Tax=Streptomyces fradiae ATCC 10745 = DSM 40063 TaxID=1319510 RepID=A0A1Y2NNX9_STRFR|nr:MULTISPECIES: hypothetical protein [Streptomyces]KAF0646578.1 hypothetical protein K701_27910 [Streptomyces fradiae ATCC 10745 = DSM 40063]OSY49205.1 hypothetical protein BG846_05183 [Streptomyces fradiae ATCC 10745 = DSM 40063]
MGHRAKPSRRHQISYAAPEKYRLIITYPGQQRPRRFSTSDLARARAVARRNTANGAHVDFQIHRGWGTYETTHTYTPEPTP